MSQSLTYSEMAEQLRQAHFMLELRHNRAAHGSDAEANRCKRCKFHNELLESYHLAQAYGAPPAPAEAVDRGLFVREMTMEAREVSQSFQGMNGPMMQASVPSQPLKVQLDLYPQGQDISMIQSAWESNQGMRPNSTPMLKLLAQYIAEQQAYSNSRS